MKSFGQLFFLQWIGGVVFVLFCSFSALAAAAPADSSVDNDEDNNFQAEVTEFFSSFVKQISSGKYYVTLGTNALGLEPAQPPRYRIGTTFIYSDGSWERVIGADAETVTWENHRGYVSSGRPDIIYRRAKWQTRTRKGSREFVPAKFLLSESSSSLWPLKVGNQMSFFEKGSQQQKEEAVKSYSTYWKCRVEGTEKVSVPAGEFAAWKITCSRFINPAKSHFKKVRELKTYYYAPELKHWVVEIKDYRDRKPTKRRELVAVMPGLQDIKSPVDIAGLGRAFQDALESKKSGEALVWRSQKARVTSIVTPRKTFKLQNGTYCRRYEQEIQTPSFQDVFFGVACRDTKGTWATPKR